MSCLHLSRGSCPGDVLVGRAVEVLLEDERDLGRDARLQRPGHVDHRVRRAGHIVEQHAEIGPLTPN